MVPRERYREMKHTLPPSLLLQICLHSMTTFLANPNAVSSMDDYLGQMAAKTMLRALSHHYIQRESRNGPFRLQLTDFHASNIFVDKEWNITCIIDHEWVCATYRNAFRAVLAYRVRYRRHNGREPSGV